MIKSRLEPWLKKTEYGLFKALAPDDPDLPSQYNEWHEIITEKLAVFSKCGVPVEKIDIGVEEFEDYCIIRGINPDGVARAAFAVYKAREIN